MAEKIIPLILYSWWRNEIRDIL